MDRKATLQETINEHRLELWAIEDEERLSKHGEFVGRCFAYRNSYSCPKGPEDYWSLYSKVTGISERGHLNLFKFQTDSKGMITVESAVALNTGTLGSPVSKNEFREAFRAISNTINGHLTELEF